MLAKIWVILSMAGSSSSATALSLFPRVGMQRSKSGIAACVLVGRRAPTAAAVFRKTQSSGGAALQSPVFERRAPEAREGRKARLSSTRDLGVFGILQDGEETFDEGSI